MWLRRDSLLKSNFGFKANYLPVSRTLSPPQAWDSVQSDTFSQVTHFKQISKVFQGFHFSATMFHHAVFRTIALSLSLFVVITRGCKCVEPQLSTTYFNSYYTRVVAAKVLRAVSTGDFVTYTFRTIKSYKGCPIDRFITTTPASSAACGISLSKGTTYIVPLAEGSGVPTITLCDVRVFLSTKHKPPCRCRVHV